MRNTPSQPFRFAANGCYRCLEATPERYEAARTHLVRDCPFPPNKGSTKQPQLTQQHLRPAQPSYRVVLFPDHKVEHQMANVSLGDTITPDQEAQYYEAGQLYNPQHFEEGWIEEINQDLHDVVESDENKHFLCYEPDFSIQTLKCHGNKIYIQNIPTRKVQTIASQINGMVAKLTIDSGSAVKGTASGRMHV